MADEKPTQRKRTNDGAPQGGARPGGRGGGGRRPMGERPKPDLDQKIISIRRVTRVVAGGRRFSFSVAMIAGNKKGMVGVGTGKAGDTSLAIAKALASAKKNMISLRLTKEMSISRPLEAKYSSARVTLMPNRGRGIVAGSAVRDIVVLAGMKDITSKIHSRTKNKLNIARAAIKALDPIGTRKHFTKEMGIHANEAPKIEPKS